MERGLMSLRDREDQAAYDSKKMYSVGSCPQYEAELYCSDCQCEEGRSVWCNNSKYCKIAQSLRLDSITSFTRLSQCLHCRFETVEALAIVLRRLHSPAHRCLPSGRIFK